jgi:hypothetical protein
VLKNSFRGISTAKFVRELLNVRRPQTLKSTEITALVPFSTATGYLRKWFRNIRRGYGLYDSCHKRTFHIPPGTLPFGKPPNAFPNQTNRLLFGSVGAFGLARDIEAADYYDQLVVCQWQRDNIHFGPFVRVVSHPPSQDWGKNLL